MSESTMYYLVLMVSILLLLAFMIYIFPKFFKNNQIHHKIK